MFNNIIYFLIVLLLFNINFPDTVQDNSLAYSLGMIGWCWLLFAFYCGLSVKRSISRFKQGLTRQLTSEYHGLILRLSILAIFLFALDIYLFDLKQWLQMIPGIKAFSSLHALLALILFILYLSTMWYMTLPIYRIAFQTELTKRSFIISNIKLNMPILFPYLILTFAFDLIDLSPWEQVGHFIARPEGQIVFFTAFIAILIVFIPPLVQYWWGCRPFQPSEHVNALKAFLKGMHFRYRDLMRWPIFEGRMMTAGVMGIVPRFRYILVTDSLMDALTIEELKAVMAHEVAHVKYRHLVFYVLFLLGFIVLAIGLSNLVTNLLATQPYFLKSFIESDSGSRDLFYFVQAIPILIMLIVYFRFVMGFFMRNFERQADLYSADFMGTPLPAISALEKIALLSGKSRDLPSWHHFSIKERVDCLWKTTENESLIKRHTRLITFSILFYFIAVIGSAYFVYFSSFTKNVVYSSARTLILEQLKKEPENIALLQGLAIVYQETDHIKEAITVYEHIIRIDSSQATALNNLAWILVTAEDQDLRDPTRALSLAHEAVTLEAIPIFLDTLAEAYWVNGFTQKAIDTINKAIALEKDDDSYYKKQLKKFMASQKTTKRIHTPAFGSMTP